MSILTLRCMRGIALASNATSSFNLLQERLRVLKYFSGAYIFWMSALTYPILMGEAKGPKSSYRSPRKIRENFASLQIKFVKIILN